MKKRFFQKNSNQYKKNKVTIIYKGAAFFERMAWLIDQAIEFIHIQTYIFDDDFTGRMILNKLKKAAARGVKVYLMVDGYASQKLNADTICSIKANGIHFKYFNRIFKSKNLYFGRRLHHKIIVVDYTKSLIGGLNITNRYNDLPDQPGWLDFAVEIEGPAAKDLCILCWKTWHGFLQNKGATPCELYTSQSVFDGGAYARIIRNDWIQGKTEISKVYHRILIKSQQKVIILGSYFLPSKSLRVLLSKAAARGVKIQIITAGRSDVIIAKYAERWLYDWILRNNIQLYEYQDNILHGKIAVCDQKWFTLGSYNINGLSAKASLEANVEIRNERLAAELTQYLEQLIEYSCLEITPKFLHKNTYIWSQFARWISYELLRILLYLFTFYFQKEKVQRRAK
ncbi:MAG: phospholipase D-like domain-containing protein [Saprospiraceae bacterium]